MDLSQQSITGPEFDLNRRGYDPDAVDAHLREIAAAVANRESQIAERETLIASLQAKVQDANESEEALRLTLKAAAHAKKELLAGAREQAKTMEADAAAKAATVVNEAEAKASELAAGAEAHAAAIKQGASAQARDVAKAALAESELLVGKIESLRQQLSAAEDALRKLTVEATPNIVAAGEALDVALTQARETVENPDLLRSAATPPPAPTVADVEPAAVVEAVVVGEPDVRPAAVVEPAEPADQSQADKPVAAEAPEQAPVDESPKAVDHQDAGEAQDPDQNDESGAPADAGEEHHEPHLEVVASAESTAEISDKVDRLLEELREVT